MPQSYCALYFHLIFSTKDRVPMIEPALRPRLYDYMGGLCKNRNSTLLAMGGMPDHVHMLISLNKELSMSAFLREVKANSSGWVHKEFVERKSFAWQKGYGSFSVSYSELDNVKEYIANQERRHARRDFKQEFIQFLETHHIKYNPQHVWD